MVRSLENNAVFHADANRDYLITSGRATTVDGYAGFPDV
jgi:hypothetical protein